jgi:hypothetical protein
MKPIILLLALFAYARLHIHGFSSTSDWSRSFRHAPKFLGPRTHHRTTADAPPLLHRHSFSNIDADDDSSVPSNNEAISVIIDTTLSESNTQKLFAWIKCAFDYDESDKNDVYAYYYNNIELAIAAAFGSNLPENSLQANCWKWR